MAEFYTLLTSTGRAKLSNAQVIGVPVSLTHMAVGDGDPATPGGAYYSPTEAQTALKHETWRGALNNLYVDLQNPSWIVAELVIPDTVGGFYIREVGLFDSVGALIAVGKFPESYKPTLPSGSNKQLYVRMILEVSNTSAVTLMVDPSVVLATRQYVDQKVTDEINKLDGKQSARVATTAAIALTGLQMIDGVQLVAGDRVLVKDQTAAKENGIYIAAAGVWTRAADADAAIEVTAGMAIGVEQGTAHADSVWLLVTDGPIVLGTTALQFDWVGRRGLAPLASPVFTGDPKAPTPAQFDADQSIATTEFVQRALGNMNNVAGYGASATLPASEAGSVIYASGSGVTLTLPSVDELPEGAAFYFKNANLINGADVVVQGKNGNTIFHNTTGRASISIPAGCDALLVSWKGIGWVLVSGSAQLPFSGLFGSSLAANGYQKLPSGLIIQWGSAAVTNAQSITFPITFPSVCLGVFAMYAGGATYTNPIVAQSGGVTRTGATLYINALPANAGATTSGLPWIAIGF